ncbi:hypothetical protein L0F63_003320 [Massospora cicadina]|nr:hypothetical protein L0F63_003320 [Massospora cicadina]
MERKLNQLIPKIKRSNPINLSDANPQRLPPAQTLLTLTRKAITNNLAERHSKKMRTLHDAQATIKVRFLSLVEIVESTPDADLPTFYRESAGVVFEVVSNMFARQVAKIRQRANASIASKEVATLEKTFPILRQMFVHLSHQIRHGWQEAASVMLFTQLLHYGNHIELRKAGLELLLTWLSVHRRHSDRSTRLFRNAIPLDVYCLDRLDPSLADAVEGSDLQLGQELIHLDDRTPLVPNPQPPSYSDSNLLFNVVLRYLAHLAHVASGAGSSYPAASHDAADAAYLPPEEYFLGFSMDSANAAIQFIFKLFQDHYLAKLFPASVNRASSEPATGEASASQGFKRCPPSLIRLLLQFLVQDCLDDSAKLQGICAQPTRVQPSPACPILKKTIFGSTISRAMVDELLRQALTLAPYGFSFTRMEAVRSAILIIGTWFVAEDDERPVFLRSSPGWAAPNRAAPFNDHACQYLDMLHSAVTWEVRPSATDSSSGPPFDATEPHPGSGGLFTQAQARCYGEIFTVYRIVVSAPSLFGSDTRLFVCHSLLEMNERLIHLVSDSPPHLSQASGRLEVGSKPLNESFESLHETLFYAWTISKVGDPELWQMFQRSLARSTMFASVMDGWALTLRRLTHILASKLYEIETDPNAADLEGLLSFGFKRVRKGVHAAARRPTRHPDPPSLAAAEAPAAKPTKRNHPTRQASWGAGSEPFAGDGAGPLPPSGQGFLVLSNYYRLAVAPNLPRSSVSSLHSVATITVASEVGRDGCQVGILGHSFQQCGLADMDYSTTSWSADEAVYIWRGVLLSLGDINRLHPVHHGRALLCVIEVYDGLQNVKSFKAPLGPSVPCAYEMAAWIVRAADLPPPFDEGRLAAYAWMCRLLSNRRAHERIIGSYGAALYRQMIKAWGDAEPRLLEILVTYGAHMFARGLRGINLLVPACIACLQPLLLEPNWGEHLRQSAIAMVGSLLHLPYQFRGLDVPILDHRQLLSGEGTKRVAVDGTKHVVQRLLLSLLTEADGSARAETHPATFAMVISALGVQLAYELVAPAPNPLFIRRGLVGILDQLYSTAPALANVAVDCVSALAAFAPLLAPEPAAAILEDIVGALNAHLHAHASAPQSCYALTRLFACLLEWLMAAPHRLLDDPRLESLVLGTLDRGLRQGSQFPSPVRDAAHSVLAHLVNSFGCSRTRPTTHLDDAVGTLFLGFNGGAILALSPTSRMVVRTSVGKFAWDVTGPTATPSLGAPPTPTVPPAARPLPAFSPEADLLADALDSVESQLRGLGLEGWIATTALPPPKAPPTLPEGPPLGPGWPAPAMVAAPLCHRACPERLLLHCLNISANHPFSAGHLVYLTAGASFARDLKALDRKPSRETVKAGLIYVADGQTAEADILCNQQPSPGYVAFAESLGWVVDLATHAGYLGGLERSGANGTTAVYFCDATKEIMFHDVTRMPNDPGDPQQVKKKRHIGNDSVHIVWNESRCDYSPCTIKGDFGNAQIVIHPLPRGMYDVRIYKDDHVGHFGPLHNGMVLSERVLPSLVRATAANAFRSILCNSVGYHHNALDSTVQRAHDIDALIRKHRDPTIGLSPPPTISLRDPTWLTLKGCYPRPPAGIQCYLGLGCGTPASATVTAFGSLSAWDAVCRPTRP